MKNKDAVSILIYTPKHLLENLVFEIPDYKVDYFGEINVR